MGLFKDSLKKWFYTNNTSAASRDARVPLLNADGTPKGSDTMANLASVLGVVKENSISVSGKTSASFVTSSCAMLIWCVRGVSFTIGVAIIENNNISLIKEGYGTLSREAGLSVQAILTFPSAGRPGAALHYFLFDFSN